MSERIAVFGGSFDPPHNGHIHLLVSLVERHSIDKVFIIPCRHSPLKKEMASAIDRMQMAKIAFGGFSFCVVLDVEVVRPGASYTVDTLEWLLRHRSDFRQAQRFLFLGADVISSLHQWKDLERVFDMATPLFATREGFTNIEDSPSNIRVLISQGLTNTGLLDISSTDIRERLHAGSYVAHLLPSPVLDYIRAYHLYV